jgi:CRP-like cAMP-binding protein
VRGGWADTIEFDEETVRAVPIFADINDDALEVVMRSAYQLHVAPGQTVIHRWHGTRHFYVVVAGVVEVRGGGESVHELRPGDFFGELAALDWGAGFGYARTADVVARTDARLLVVAPAALGELLRRAPRLDAILRATARDRLRLV